MAEWAVRVTWPLVEPWEPSVTMPAQHLTTPQVLVLTVQVSCKLIGKVD